MIRSFSKLLFLAAAAALVLSTAPNSGFSEDKKQKDSDQADEADVQNLSGKDGLEWVCEADISYIWSPKPHSSANKRGQSRTAKAADEKKRTEFWATVGEHGLVEEEVKARIENKLPLQKKKALEHCRRVHQDQAGCIAAGLRSRLSSYNSLDFAARDAILEALREDCRENFGVCLDAEATSPECFISRPSDLPNKKDEESDDSKKKKK